MKSEQDKARDNLDAIQAESIAFARIMYVKSTKYLQQALMDTCTNLIRRDLSEVYIGENDHGDLWCVCLTS